MSATKAHGALMIMAWVFLAPVGILTATRFKKDGPPPTWFKVHRSFLALASCLTLLAFMIILIDREGLDLAATHPKLGFVVVIGVIIQPLSGFFRAHLPEKGKKKSFEREMWEVQHQWTGRFLATMGVAAVVTGIQLFFAGDFARPGAFVLVGLYILAGLWSFYYVFLVREPKVQKAKKRSPRAVKEVKATSPKPVKKDVPVAAVAVQEEPEEVDETVLTPSFKEKPEVEEEEKEDPLPEPEEADAETPVRDFTSFNV